jgi:SAM-dependent methyltransferase
MVQVNIIDDRFVEDENLPEHLGGHEGETHLDEGALTYLQKKFDIKTMLDVGCGLGEMKLVADKLGVDWYGLDGDYTVARNPDIFSSMLIHDYRNEPDLMQTGDGTSTFDLAWSVEFLEHVDAEYIYNFMKNFRQCKYVLCTHALPGQPGKWHVNCQPPEYWVAIFRAFGFEVDVETTNEVRAASTMRERYVRQQSLFFKNMRTI